ncbi:MAG: sigma-70 family RNA polymerase sigma factor [Planctomycetota bacterium]|nr:sigma-70 family RNA polymerase sigma factor [Planctomycetota bacterium]
MNAPLSSTIELKAAGSTAGASATSLASKTAEELAVLAQRDNVAAFGELVVRFEGRLFNFLLRRVASRVEAEDLTQEAFVRAWERITSYDPTWRFSTWLFTIASRLAVSEHRRRRPTVVLDSADQVGRCDADIGESEHAEQGGSRLWALAKLVLREDQHTALWLRYAEDMTIGEIAKVMGKTQVGVRVALFRARQTLAEAARASGIGQGFEADTQASAAEARP